mgnify:CR=1 FL=1
MDEDDDKPDYSCNIAQEMDFEKIKKIQYLHVESRITQKNKEINEEENSK